MSELAQNAVYRLRQGEPLLDGRGKGGVRRMLRG
jgi:hypothetical protein